MTLSDRLADTLKKAELSPRHFGGAIQVHFVTIYRALNGDGERQPIHELVITTSLDKIDKLLESGVLPFQEKLSRKDKTAKLKDLLNNHD